MSRRNRHNQRGAALVEMALCLAVFTPILFAGVRLAYGANQVHEAVDAVSAGARAGGSCAGQEEIRRMVQRELPGVKPEDVVISIDRTGEPALIRVSIENFRVARLAGSQPLPQAPSATFPYVCE
jgi:TadE-like protein